MKQTEIDYVELPHDMVRIVSVRGASGYSEVVKEFGFDVFNYYSCGLPRYVRNIVTNTGGAVVIDCYGCGVHIEPGDLFHKKEFDRLISVMRAAGERLGRIRKEVEAAKVRTVKI